MTTLHEELAFALSLADDSRGILLKHFGTGMAVEWKGDNTPVTLADRAAEEALRNRIAKATPGYGIIGEEFGSEAGSVDREWVIDPIDGTKAFIHGVPLFGTLIALLEKGEPVVGLIDLPALGQRVYATRGGGCFLNGNPCGVSKVARLEEALILDGSVTTMERLGHGLAWAELRRKARLHRGWGDCYGHFLVATGAAEVMADPVVEIWDIAPMAVILPEAGGRFTGLLGTPGIHNRSGLSSNGLLHDVVTAGLTADPV
ncbi:MAG: putative histidinol-phosphate phosphatase [Fibrobacteria bacterium]|jgi:myo-inositol-1(or 4)-monophosphatase|nr:putative histidinol-phosphate phosphatase [Fibrobacteria bacterium]